MLKTKVIQKCKYIIGQKRSFYTKEYQPTANRYRNIDYLETVSLFLVVFCHYPTMMPEGLITNILLQLTTVAVPIFLMCNGALLFSKPYNLSKHMLRTGKYLVITLIWRLVYLLISLRAPWSKGIEAPGANVIFYYFCGENISTPYVPAEHFWYMYMLLCVYLVFPMFKLAMDKDRKTAKYLFILLFILSFGFAEYNGLIRILMKNKGVLDFSVGTLNYFMNPFSAPVVYAVYMIMGYVLHRKFYRKYLENPVYYGLIAASIAGIALSMLQRHLEVGDISGAWQRLPDDYFRVPNMITAMSIFILMTGKEYYNTTLNAVMESIASKSMHIYAVHMLLCVCGVQHYAGDTIPEYPAPSPPHSAHLNVCISHCRHHTTTILLYLPPPPLPGQEKASREILEDEEKKKEEKKKRRKRRKERRCLFFLSSYEGDTESIWRTNASGRKMKRKTKRKTKIII